MNALILAAGDILITPRLLAEAQSATLVIAADGGLRHAARLRVTPELIVGDFDSLSPADVAAWPDVPREEHPEDKDMLDLEIAVDAALARGAGSLLIAGAFGSRLDQSFAALLIAAPLKRDGLDVRLVGGASWAWPLAAGTAVEPPLEPGTTFSVLALDEDCTVSIAAARFELDHARLPFGSGFGVSNSAVRGGPPRVTLHSGLAVVIAQEEAA